MVGLQLVAGQAVAGHQRSAGPQHPGNLGEQPILELVGRHVMQHREARRAGEPGVGIGERRRVAAHDLHRGNVGETVGQHGRQLVVDLDRRQLRHRLAENVGGGAVSGPDFEDVLTEVDVAQCPRKDDLPDRLPPFVAAAMLMCFVHRTCARPRCSTASRFAAMSSPVALRSHWAADSASMARPSRVAASSMR